MGSKSSNAPAPDPQLIAAQIRSMGIQDDVIQRIVGVSERMQPIQMEQMQFGLDTSRQAYTQSQEDRGWALQRRGALTNAQDQLQRESEGYNTEQRRDQLRGEAYGDVTQAYSNAMGQNVRAMGRAGVNPSDGKMASMMRQTSVDQANAMTSASHKVNAAARAEGYALTDRTVNSLAGYPAMAMQGSGQGAGFGGLGLQGANAGMAGMSSGYGAAGQMAGQMGQNATGMYGAQAQYKLGSDRQAAASNPFGALLGAGADMASAAMGAGLFSDRRLKQDIEAVGRDERTGLTIYEFSYKSAPEHRYSGVMADEVGRIMPTAVMLDDSGYYRVDYPSIGIKMVYLGVTA